MIYKSPTIIFLAICGFLRFRIFRCKEISYHIFSSDMYRKHDKPNVLKICEYDQLYLPPNPQVFGVLGFLSSVFWKKNEHEITIGYK